MKIKNIIFDFDGTLVDTSKLIVATMQQSIRESGLPFKDPEEIKATIGLRLEEIPSALWPGIYGIGEKFAAVYRKNFEVLKEEIPVTLFPDVKETLERLKREGCNLAIATSRSLRSVRELTERLRIKENFLYLLGGDTVSHGKPHPESIEIILKELNCKAEETMMVGDMAVDIIMGKNAGITAAGVTYGNGKESELREAGADFILESFKWEDFNKSLI